MTRPHNPGDAVIDGRGTWILRGDGSYVRFDRARRAHSDPPPTARRPAPRDDRLFIL